MQNNELVKLAMSYKKKTKTRDLAPLYEYAKKNNITEEELSTVIKKIGLWLDNWKFYYIIYSFKFFQILLWAYTLTKNTSIYFQDN